VFGEGYVLTPVHTQSVRIGLVRVCMFSRHARKRLAVEAWPNDDWTANVGAVFPIRARFRDPGRDAHCE